MPEIHSDHHMCLDDASAFMNHTYFAVKFFQAGTWTGISDGIIQIGFAIEDIGYMFYDCKDLMEGKENISQLTQMLANEAESNYFSLFNAIVCRVL